ncbi:MAG: agmatine deiminase [Gammaproteobacteria bacterium]|jgi:agmatine deiminase|nr:agmatine deiminase [Gammaproteobacteria bacterium]
MTYILPPEWAAQSGVMLTWPHTKRYWKNPLAVEPTFVNMAREIALKEPVIISCYSEEHLQQVKKLLEQAGALLNNIRLYIAPSNDIWVRDHGPITVLKNGKPTLLDFQFNSWGSKYPGEDDNLVTSRLHKQQVFATTPLETVDVILEGGSIEVNGAGVMLTTSHCILNANRNKDFTKQTWETIFAKWFGIKHILWLEHGGLKGDDTDSHIDTLARFTDENTICYVRCDDPNDEHYAELQKMELELQAFRNLAGKPFRLMPLPWPKAKFDNEGKRLPATYANFLIINQAVLVPTYADAADEEALAQIQRCFPDRSIIGIDCLKVIPQYGSLHCATMQLPAGVIPS